MTRNTRCCSSAGPEIDQAKQICDGCLVRARCLDWALSNGASAGIWGGRTEAERHAMSTIAVTDQGTSQGYLRVRCDGPGCDDGAIFR